MDDGKSSNTSGPNAPREEHSLETRFALASRAALRVIGYLRRAVGGKPNDLDMKVLRAVLISSARGSGQPSKIDWNAAYLRARDARDDIDAGIESSGFIEGLPAAYSAFSSIIANAEDIAIREAIEAETSDDSNPLDEDGTNRYRSTVAASKWDADHRQNLRGQPVWAGAEPSLPLAENHERLLTDLSTDDAWKFWRRFYEGMWEGTFDEWDLAFEVIQIDEEYWQKGHVEVGKEIARIEARRDLEKRIQDLKAELAVVRAAPPAIGHNNPPEAIDEATPEQALTIIWAAIDDIETEVRADPPNIDNLQSLQNPLKTLLNLIGTFTKDIAYDYAKTTVTAGVPIMAWLNWPKIQALLVAVNEKLVEYIAYLIWLVG